LLIILHDCAAIATAALANIYPLMQQAGLR